MEAIRIVAILALTPSISAYFGTLAQFLAAFCALVSNLPLSNQQFLTLYCDSSFDACFPAQPLHFLSLAFFYMLPSFARILLSHVPYRMIRARTSLRPCTAQKHSSYLPVLERTKVWANFVFKYPMKTYKKTCYLFARNKAPFIPSCLTTPPCRIQLALCITAPAFLQASWTLRRVRGLPGPHKEIQDRQTATVSISPSCHKFMSPTYHHICSHSVPCQSICRARHPKKLMPL